MFLILPVLLALAQPYCKTLHRYCATDTNESYNPCPFGGCYVNDAGTLLAVDAFDNAVMTFVYGDKNSPRDIPTTGTIFLRST